jgi:thiol-disulfide isomerase/thioredoxin
VKAGRWATTAGFVLVAASSCGGREVSSPATTKHAATLSADSTTRATASTSTTQPSAYTVPQIRTITAKQIRALVDENKGKIVVINFWATWCPPCVREFPALIKAYGQYHGKGVNMYAVSMNSPEEKADIDEFLQAHKPPFPIYLKDAQDAKFNETVLKGWFGEMPMTLVFDAAGKRVLAHTAEITSEKLSSTLDPLLPPQ